VLSERCRAPQSKLLDDTTREVRLVIEFAEDAELESRAVEPVRARIPAAREADRAGQKALTDAGSGLNDIRGASSTGGSSASWNGSW
jgi:hypothetical protein